MRHLQKSNLNDSEKKMFFKCIFIFSIYNLLKKTTKSKLNSIYS